MRLHLIILLITLVCAAAPAGAAERADIVVDAASGRIAHAHNIDGRVFPASLTKVMTLVLVFEALERGRLHLDQALPVSARAAAQPPTRLGLRAGDTISVRTAIEALAVKSSNDVAVVVAEALGGSEEAFARAMTITARNFGMTRTTFRNASGLPDPRQVTTARDMALLARVLLLRYPRWYGVFSQKTMIHDDRTLTGHNALLSTYPGCDGIKTGYIDASGFNLMASASRQRRRWIIVSFGWPSAHTRNKSVSALFDRAFNGDFGSTARFSPSGPRSHPGGQTPVPVDSRH